jgi:hypothetical protein
MEDQYLAFQQQINAPTPHTSTSHQRSSQHQLDADEDLDMDAQLKNVSPEHGGSFIQVSLERQLIQASHATSPKSARIIESTPHMPQHRNPRIEDASESQNTKRRKADDFTATSTIPRHPTPTPSTSRSKRATTLGIDMLGQMWLGFHMHEALAIQLGKKLLVEKRTDAEFTDMGTPASEVREFRSLRRAFPRTKQTLFPNERPDAVPGQHLHFTQIPRYEKISHTTGLTNGFHVTIRFDGDYKSLNRKEVKTACMERLRHMDMPLGTAYTNPIDIGINTVTRNWAGFLKLHLLNPMRDGIALLRGGESIRHDHGRRRNHC